MNEKQLDRVLIPNVCRLGVAGGDPLEPFGQLVFYQNGLETFTRDRFRDVTENLLELGCRQFQLTRLSLDVLPLNGDLHRLAFVRGFR